MWHTPKTCSPSLVAGPRLTFSFSAGAAFLGAMPDPQASRQDALQHAAKELQNSTCRGVDVLRDDFLCCDQCTIYSIHPQNVNGDRFCDSLLKRGTKVAVPQSQQKSEHAELSASCWLLSYRQQFPPTVPLSRGIFGG